MSHIDLYCTVWLHVEFLGFRLISIGLVSIYGANVIPNCPMGAGAVRRALGWVYRLGAPSVLLGAQLRSEILFP